MQSTNHILFDSFLSYTITHKNFYQGKTDSCQESLTKQSMQ